MSADLVIGLSAAGDAPVGAKAAALTDLQSAGFEVPDAFVITADWYRRVLTENGVAERVAELLGSLTVEPTRIEQVAAELATLIADLRVSPALTEMVNAAVTTLGAKQLAVRSSATLEDLPDASFAGQYRTELEVAPADVVTAAMACFASATSADALTYLTRHGLAADADFAVIVQTFIPAEFSAVAFTINPLTGVDTEIVAELVPGRGDALVSGRRTGEPLVHDWWTGATSTAPTTVPTSVTEELVQLALRVQRHRGAPADLELAWWHHRWWLLQARPITRVHHTAYPEQWTTANFKDGGVSSAACSQFMWSLYDLIWSDWMPKFLVDSGLISAGRLGQVGRMIYGRPYWNLTVTKEAMATAPGYTERQFDAELGVPITYHGPGTVTRVTPRSLLAIGQAAIKHRRIRSTQERQVEADYAELTALADRLSGRLGASSLSREELEGLWRELVFSQFHRAAGGYFWQIFINTIHQQLAHKALVKAAGEQGYFTLISGLPELAHVRPFSDAWALSRELRTEPTDLHWWGRTTPEQIAAALDAGQVEHHLDRLRQLLHRHAHHSTRELDITHPDFDEDPLPLIGMVIDCLELDDDASPEVARLRLEQRHRDLLAEVTASMPRWRARRFSARVEQARSMLWWREELRDLSTRFYHLVRLATLQLAELWVADGLLEHPAQIWAVTITDVAAVLDGTLSAAQLAARIERGQTYFDSFANYLPPTDVGGSFEDAAVPDTGQALVGLAASPGQAVGRARVVTELDQLDRLVPGDILVARFTDTGWTGKFPLLAAVVTDYGGVLCHSSIISRECGIPCVVALPGASTTIPDGAQLRVDGSTGRVTILDCGTLGR